jgi:hypothetical protein
MTLTLGPVNRDIASLRIACTGFERVLEKGWLAERGESMQRV